MSNDREALLQRIRDLEEAQRWKPIDTAPKDGTELILWPGIRKPVAPAVGAWLNTSGGPCWYDLAVGHHNGFWNPTHWMPMPSGPLLESPNP